MTISEDNKKLLEILEERIKQQPRDEKGRFKRASVHEIAKQFGVPTDNNTFRVFASSQEFPTEREAKAAVFELGVQMFKKSPTDADLPSGVARRQPMMPLQERLMQEYREGSKNLRGTQLIKFKQTMRDKGLEIT